jgi:hypothetical protein
MASAVAVINPLMPWPFRRNANEARTLEARHPATLVERYWGALFSKGERAGYGPAVFYSAITWPFAVCS